jgi:hypothetical protein
MRTTHSLALLSTGAALGLAGCTLPDTNPGPTPDPLPLASSFNVAATLSFPPDNGSSGLPATEDFLLRLDDAADGSVVAVLADGSASTRAAFARTRTGISLRESVELSITPFGNGYWDARLSFDSLDLVPIDNDGDGSADVVEGSGSGEFSQLVGDVVQTVAFTIEMSGGLDDRTPYLSNSVTMFEIPVMDGLTLIASEPLRLPSTARISVGGKSIPLEMLPAGAPYVTEFRTRSILPFGAEVVTVIEPELLDLAGLGIEFGLERIGTPPDPGMFAEDGFEGELAAVSNGVEVVTGFGTLPAISGTRSLLVPESWSTLTMRVPLEEGDTHLRFEARALFDAVYGLDCAPSRVRVGFPALDQITTIDPRWNRDIEEDTGDERWTAATPVTTVELALPDGAGNEVIFDIFQLGPQPGRPCAEVGLLIDDLRAE